MQSKSYLALAIAIFFVSCSSEPEAPTNENLTTKDTVIFGEITIRGMTGSIDVVGRGRASADSMRIDAALPPINIMSSVDGDSVMPLADGLYWGRMHRIDGHGELTAKVWLEIDPNALSQGTLKAYRHETREMVPNWSNHDTLSLGGVNFQGSWDDTVRFTASASTLPNIVKQVAFKHFYQTASMKELNGHDSILVGAPLFTANAALDIKLWRQIR